MREYTKNPDNQSRTLDSNSKLSRQAPIDVILQRYKERNMQQYVDNGELIQGKFSDTVQREEFNENELLQGKLNIAQREEIDDEELLQGKFDAFTAQREEIPSEGGEANLTGMPDDLKSGIESLSGYSMDEVRVHYNSSKPAQLQALAYTQGTDIHIAPGQEQHLPHEAWHVVQQKQGRVQPTTQLQGVNVNDNERLEKEADVMGGKSLSVQLKSDKNKLTISSKMHSSCIIQKEIDEIKTKEMLGRIYDMLLSKDITKWETAIYDILGTEQVDPTYFDHIDDTTKFAEDFISQNYPEYSSESVYEQIKGGDYFHLEDIGGEIDERMILNLKKQSDAFNLMKYIADKRKEKSSIPEDEWIHYISTAKFYAGSSLPEDNLIKYDKVVIYYHSDNRTTIKNGILSFLDIREKDESENETKRTEKFKDDISGFYDKIAPGMGVGEEIGEGTSFTGERTNDILAYISGLIVLPDKDKFCSDAYEAVGLSRLANWLKRTFG